MIDGKVAVAVVGCGGMGGGHAVAIATGSGQALWMTDGSKGRELLPGDTDLTTKMVLAGTYDIKEDRQEWARKQGFFTYNSFEDILADERVDVVLVATPNDDHKELSIRAMRAGKNVLCEKPAAMNADLAAQMQKAADDNGVILNIGVCNRFNTSVNKIAELIQAGVLGNLYHVYCSFRAHRSIPGLGGAFTTKARSGGGALIDWGVHYLDLILYCLGDPAIKTVSAAAYSVLGKDIEGYVYESMWAGPPVKDGVYDVDDMVTGFVRTEGPTLSFNGAWAQNIGEGATFIEFMGDKGGIKLQYGGGFVLYSTLNGMLTETHFKYQTENMYNAEVRDFLIKAPQGIKTKANIDKAIITSRLMDMIYRSSELGEEVKA